MAFVGVTRETDDDATRGRLPIRSEETGERRDNIHAAVVLDRASKCFNIGARGEQTKIVAQPLNESASDRDAAFESVACRLLSKFKGDSGDQSVFGLNRFFACVHEQKTTGAISVLGLTTIEAGLTNKRGLLIPKNSGDRNAG